ncbi:MAG: NAD(P)H-hydrate dehydratase [Alphaproteobacteria bacterium]|nr:NAD(P)H-hydrate dehydratase [Alphaproteobacteria bacterium]
MILNSSEIKAIEQKEFKLRKSSYSLMQSAGEKCADYISLNISKNKELLVVCGPGNNGGDGFVIGNSLITKGHKVKIFLILPLKNKKNDNYKAFKRLDCEVFNLKDLLKELKKKTKPIIVDCIFGTGLNKNLSSSIKDIVRAINKKKTFTISIDMPTGISSDNGQAMGEAIKANLTLALHCKKIGHVLFPGVYFSGVIKVLDIGIRRSLNKIIDNRIKENNPNLWINKKFPWKKYNSHKYSRGRVYIYGSLKNYIGASLLSSSAAIRCGTGSVTIISNKDTIDKYNQKFFSLLKVEINSDEELKNFLNSSPITSFLIGPGAGVNQQTIDNVKLISKFVSSVVIDADAITSFTKNSKELFSILDKNKIITPHEGEFNRIFSDLKNVKNKIEKSIKAAKKANCVLVFKGPDTIIASPDGEICINTISTEELAVIGSGDVLSGIIASLIGKNKMSAFDGACAGVWLHSYAARMIKKGLIAEDIIKNLPKALEYLAKKYN